MIVDTINQTNQIETPAINWQVEFIGEIDPSALLAAIPPDVLAADRAAYDEAQRIEAELAAEDALASQLTEAERADNGPFLEWSAQHVDTTPAA